MRYFVVPRAIAVALGVSVVISAWAAPPRRFTVRDSIGFSTFLYPGQQFGQPVSQVSFSPDGSHFVAVTMRGDLDSGKRVATLWLFDSKAVRSYLAKSATGSFTNARPLTRWASASDREPISNWRWNSDSRSVLYLAADDDGAEHLYRIGIAGGRAVALSRSDQDVSRFDERNGTVVYFAHKPIRANELYQAGGPSLPDIVVGTGKNILPLLFPNWMDTVFHSSEDELWKVEKGNPVAVMDTSRNTPIRVKDSKLVLAPDGRSAIVTPFVHYIPKSWERYRPLENYPGLEIVADTPETVGSTGNYRLKEYASIDLASGKTSLFVDAPIDLMTEFSDLMPQWSADGSRIALPGAYPLLSDVPGTQAIYPCTVIVVDTRAKQHWCLQTQKPINAEKQKYGDRKQIVKLQWNGDRELVAQYATPNAPDKKTETVFTQNDGAWTAKSSDVSAAPDQLIVEVQQAIDEPPVLVAHIGNGPPLRLLDPNPQLKDIALGTASLYHWRDADGDTWTGALVKPPNYSPNKRYPLVVQTHGLDRAKFLVDGPSATGFAARALAAHDIVVLQVDEINKNSGTGKEAETGASGYRAAIQQLVREGVVDPAKVGIIAWSHYGPQMLQGLIDNPHTYAAATIAEADYNSYDEYLMNIDYMGKEREQMFRAQFGSKPFGTGLKNWLDQSPGFHMDRICAPVLFNFNSPVALVYGWDGYAALRAQNKPVDLLYLRNGNHVLVKPLERLAEQGMNVDWYDYWLNGHKDPDPSKVAQYKRWDAMKVLPRCDKEAGKP